jgi:hypothetical protein
MARLAVRGGSTARRREAKKKLSGTSLSFILAFRILTIAWEKIPITNPAGVAMLAVALAFRDQVQQVGHRHVGAVQGMSATAAPT